MSERVVCETCPRHCSLAFGEIGFCHARQERNERIVAANYGRITSIALDPIEKKPLAFFMPGSNVLSVGSYGCNLRCSFCQNDSISQHGEGDVPWREIAPDELARIALGLRSKGNIGVAYTYNEPLVGWEFVADTAEEVRKLGMKNILVSNGCVETEIAERIAPLIDAANIDLKGPDQSFYDWIGGRFEAVCNTIRILNAAKCHVEATMLVIPGRNDSEEAVREVSGFLASVSPGITLHVTRFFPRFRMMDARATPVETIYRLAEVARENLKRVLTGNC